MSYVCSVNNKQHNNKMKFLEQTTAILFALIAILALILAIAHFSNVYVSGIFGLIFGFAAFAAYIIHEESNEL